MNALNRSFSGSTSCSETRILTWQRTVINDVETADDRFLYKNNFRSLLCSQTPSLSPTEPCTHFVRLFSLFPTHTLTAIFISMSMAVLNGCGLCPLLCVCACLCALIVRWSSPSGAVWDVWKRLRGIGKEGEGDWGHCFLQRWNVFMRVPVWRGCSRLPEVGRKPHAAYTGADKKEEKTKLGCGKGGREGCFSKPTGR